MTIIEPGVGPDKWDETVPQNHHGAGRILDHSALGAIADAPSVTFLFDGAAVIAREGESIVSALLAAGFRVFRTMPESDAPRGGYCMVGRCGDCQVVVDGLAGVRSCVTPVQSGMVVQTQRGVGLEDMLDFLEGAQ